MQEHSKGGIITPVMEVPVTPGEEKPESTEKKSTGRVRNAAEVLQQWLHFRAAGEKPEASLTDAETEDSEEDDEEEGSVKRWRAIFRKFFGSQVTREEQADNGVSQTPPETVPTLPLFMTEALPQTEPTPVSTENESPHAEQTTGVPLTAETITPETTPLVTPEEPAVEEPIIPQTEASQTELPFQEVPLDPVAAARYEQSVSEETPVADTAELPLTPQATVENHAIYSRAPIESTPKIDTIADPDVTDANLRRSNLINTYRNHRRKKDVKQAYRQIDELQKTTEKLEQQIRAERTNTHDTVLQPVAAPLKVETARSQPEVKQPITAAPERTIEKPAPKAPESVRQILEKRAASPQPIEVVETVVAPVMMQEKAPEKAPAQIQKQAEKLASQSYEAVNPVTILEQVEQAAEADVAIESLFEHRHEAKDNDAAYRADDPSTAPAGGFVPVTDTPVINAVQGQINDPANQVARTTPRFSKPQNSEEAYLRAAKSGFWSAVVLLVFVAILLIIR